MQTTHKNIPLTFLVTFAIIISYFFSFPAFHVSAMEKSPDNIEELQDQNIEFIECTSTSSIVRENTESGHVISEYNSDTQTLTITEYNIYDVIESEKEYSAEELASLILQNSSVSRSSYTSHISCYTSSKRNYDIYTYPTYVLWDAYRSNDEKHYIQNNVNITKLNDYKGKVDSLSGAEQGLIAYAGASAAAIGFGAAVTGGSGAALATLTQLIGGVPAVYSYSNALGAADTAFNAL